MIRFAQLPLGCYFVLIQSNQKSSQPKCFFAAHGLRPANQAKPRAAIFLPLLRRT